MVMGWLQSWRTLVDTYILCLQSFIYSRKPIKLCIQRYSISVMHVLYETHGTTLNKGWHILTEKSVKLADNKLDFYFKPPPSHLRYYILKPNNQNISKTFLSDLILHEQSILDITDKPLINNMDYNLLLDLLIPFLINRVPQNTHNTSQLQKKKNK